MIHVFIVHKAILLQRWLTQPQIPYTTCPTAQSRLAKKPTIKTFPPHEIFLSFLFKPIALPNAAFPCYKQRDSLNLSPILYACGKFGVSLTLTTACFLAGSVWSAGNGLASMYVCKGHQKSQSCCLFSCLYGKSLRGLFWEKLKCDTRRSVLWTGWLNSDHSGEGDGFTFFSRSVFSSRFRMFTNLEGWYQGISEEGEGRKG